MPDYAQLPCSSCAASPFPLCGNGGGYERYAAAPHYLVAVVVLLSCLQVDANFVFRNPATDYAGYSAGGLSPGGVGVGGMAGMCG